MASYLITGKYEHQKANKKTKSTSHVSIIFPSFKIVLFSSEKVINLDLK